MSRTRAPIKVPDVLDMIQQNIEAVKHVREYQSECDAVSKRLVRLKVKLDGSSEQLSSELGNIVFEKIIQRLSRSLTRIRNLISECQNPNENLKGPKKLIATQALKRELDNMKFSLINYEADLTADLQQRKEILSKACGEKQAVDRSRQNAQIDERARLLLNMVETEAQLLARSHLPKLYKDHEEIIDHYLIHCTKVHTKIPVVGLEATMKGFVTNIYQLEESAYSDNIAAKIQTIELPVESVYIHLQADQSTTFEREQARKLLLQNKVDNSDDDHDRVKDVYDREMWMELAAAPIIDPSIEREKVNREKNSDKASFREILRNNRWIVILGDPGSGKTTFVRWLVSKYIQEIGKDKPTVYNNINHENEDEENNEEENDKIEKFAVGLPRMPILICVGEFVEALRKKEDLSLIDYIGFHTWMGNPMLDLKSEQSEEERNTKMKELQVALHDYIKLGYALIVLDGLDEIPETETRSRVVRLVEDFVVNHIQTPSSVSVTDDPFVNREFDIPYKAGGNQLIITSRIAGYYAQPLSGQFSHYTILPMEIDDTKKFAEHWFRAVHKTLISLLQLEITEEKQENVCSDQIEVLKRELDKTVNKGLRQMASNPCLMNFICLIASRTRHAELPAQRIRLYNEIADLMMDLWISRYPIGFASHPNRVNQILRDIATYIHKNCPSGLIESNYLKMICSKSLQKHIGAKSKSEQEKSVNECVDQFQRNAAILAARGQHLYGFLHLTLQEYYTCQKLVGIDRDNTRSKKLVELFQEHITDPRFRVPLTLALGWVSWKWEKPEFDEFCHILFTSENHLSHYFPLEILMFITSTDELEKLPSNAKIFIGLDRLLSIAAKNDWHRNYPNIENKMAVGLLKLPRKQIETWINQICSSEKSTTESISALLALLKECERIDRSEESEEKKVLLKQWVTSDICKHLPKYLSNDNIHNQFLIDAVLTKIAILKPTVLPSNDMKKFFIENRNCVSQLNLTLLAAIIALYGGLKFSYEENKNKPRQPFEHDDLMVTSTDFSVVFSHDCIHRNSPLSTFLIEHMRAQQKGTQVEDLRSTFINSIQQNVEKIQPDDASLKAVDTFILMFCIVGVDEVWLYRDFVNYKAFHLAIDRFKRISNYLRQFYFIPEIYNIFEKSISSKDSLLSNFDNFEEYMYKSCSINRDSTHLIHLFMDWHRTADEVHRQSSSKYIEILFRFINSICRGRARLCTSSRTALTNKWLCKTDQRFLLLPKFFRKQENLKSLFASTSSHSSICDISLSMFLRTLWIFNDSRHGANISEVTIKKAEYSMLFDYDRNHSFALTFVPKHLQLVFSRALQKSHIVVQQQYKNPIVIENSSHKLSFAHIICSSLLSICNLPVAYACQSALVALLPLARFYRLEHLVLSLLYWSQRMSEHDPGAVKWYFEEMKRPIDKNHFSYADNYNKLTDVDRVEISDTEVDNQFRKALEQAVHRLHDALQLLKSDDSVEAANMEIFFASVSLGYLCWSSESEKRRSLFEDAMQAASEINNPLVRFDALSILASCPFLRSSETFATDLNEIQLKLNSSTKKAFSKLPPELTPLLAVSFVDKYITLLGADGKVIEKVNHILGQVERMNEEDDRLAISVTIGVCVNLNPDISSKLFSIMKTFTVSSVLKRAQVLCFDSPLLKYFANDSNEHKPNSNSFLNDRDHSQSLSVLYASLYLANLSSDVQKLSQWLNIAPLSKIDVSRLSNRQNDLPPEKFIVTYSHIDAIETKLSSLDDSTEISPAISALEIDLYNFHYCEWSARKSLEKWLKHKNDSFYYVLACHAALILGRSNVWTIENAHIICDLLRSDSDRLRQEAESLLNGKERKTSELGWDVLITFIERFISYETESAYASSILSLFFGKLTIDNTEHLNNIIELEQKRTAFHKKYKTNTEDLSTLKEQQKLFENCSPIARWFTHLSPDVLQAFLTYLKSFITDLPIRRNRDRLKLTESHRLFVFSWCAQILAMDSNSFETILKMLAKVLQGNYGSNSQISAAFVIGHSNQQEARQILLDIIENKVESDVSISEHVIAMCVHAYCWSYNSNTIQKPKVKKGNNDADNEEGNNKEEEEDNKLVVFCEQLLKHQSSDVQNAASIELAKVCHNIEKLLEYFENDPMRCYQYLIRVRIDQKDTRSLKKHSKCVFELIKTYPDLLRIYFLELYDSLKHFGEQLEPYPEWSIDFGELCLVDIACVLIDEMPSSFFYEVDQMADEHNLRRVLFRSSKQHNLRRRHACIKLLASFGDFDVEICELLINSLVDNTSTQEVCLDALKYFRKPRACTQKESVLRQLDQTLELTEPIIDELKKSIAELKFALLELKKPRGCLKQVLTQLKSISHTLKSDQEELKGMLEQLKSMLNSLKPILKQWESAIECLINYLRSPSLIKRWGTAILLERLVQCSVLSAARVQYLLSETIENPSSASLIWLGKIDNNCTIYNSVGSLNHMLCKLLMRMSSVDETSVEVNVTQKKNRILEDFQIAETSAELASCVNIDEDPLDSDYDTDDSDNVDRQKRSIAPTRRNSSQVLPQKSQNPTTPRERASSAVVAPSQKNVKKDPEKSSICSVM